MVVRRATFSRFLDGKFAGLNVAALNEPAQNGSLLGGNSGGQRRQLRCVDRGR